MRTQRGNTHEFTNMIRWIKKEVRENRRRISISKCKRDGGKF